MSPKKTEPDTKNKHRISDARWRNSVSRCYNLLKQCSYAEQESTRMAILCLTLEQIQSTEGQIADLGYLDQAKAIFGQGEALSLQQQQQQQHYQQHSQQ